MNERETIDRGWYYVVEPDGGAHAPPEARIVADDGRVLTRRLHGHPGRIEVEDASGASLSAATLLRAAGAVGRALEARGEAGRHVRVVLAADEAPAATVGEDGRLTLRWDGLAVASAPSHHPIEAAIAAFLEGVEVPEGSPRVDGSLPERPVERALFFESLMNTDMPHNDREISQGVLHLVSPLRDLATEVVLVNAKMPIVGDDRPVLGLERLEAALAAAPVQLVCITLLEGYWEGVQRLIRTIRAMGCRAHVAVGGVMPSLAPEHVAAHLEDVSFVCRGAGEVFLPRLVSILGPCDVDTPLTEAQRAALLAMDGMIVVERAAPGLRLLTCRSDRTVQVGDLDRVPLDLSFVEARHIEGGIEIATSRGCIHKCSFCSILGRESYQARSAGSIFELLSSYEARFRELYGEHIPHNAYRVHISDDDFACDRERARTFFETLRDTPFRLSSVQVAVGDLCRKVGGRLLAEPDHELLDAIRAECFADHGRPIPVSDWFADHKSRNWSSFLQIGVETYSDAEIARLGKGYKRVHVRTIVAELSRRDLHMDGYFILSNVDTRAEDLVDVFEEVARLKLRFPKHFHMRFPVVQHLVSYFTAASHRRHVRRGRTHVMKLRGFAGVPGHAELDYPFVDHDEPEDRWVRDTVADTFVTDRGLYTENLSVLREQWMGWLHERPDDPDRRRIERLARRLDDGPRRLVFDMLRHARQGTDADWPCAVLDEEEAFAMASAVLGDVEGWRAAWRRHLTPGPRWLLWQGQGSAPDPVLWEQAVDLLCASERPDRRLRIEGVPPEALALESLVGRPDRRTATAVVCLEAAPSDEVLARWAGLPVVVELAARDRESLGGAVRTLARSGLTFQAVVPLTTGELDTLPTTLAALFDAGLGRFRLVPVDDGTWDAEAFQRLGGVLFAMGRELRARWQRGERVTWLDMLDGESGEDEVVVQPTGRILVGGRTVARLADLTCVDRHALDATKAARSPAMRQVERVLESCSRWLAQQGGTSVATGSKETGASP